MHPPQPLEYRLMSDERRQADAEGDQGSGLFGKLPSARPGVRSPRRRAEGAEAVPEATPGQVGGAAPKRGPQRPEPETASRDVPPQDTTGHTPPPPPPTQPEGSPGPEPRHIREPLESEGAAGRDAPGVEDLAWAGVTVAAEAATLGVRLLSRAIGAVRKPADPR
jgi:hypothetical protein